MIGLLNKGLEMIGGAMNGLQQMGKGLATGNPMEFLQGFKQLCQSAMQAMPQGNQGAGGQGGGGGCPGLSMNPMDFMKRLFGGGGGQEGVSNTPGGGGNGGGGGNPMQMLDRVIHDLGKLELSCMSMGILR